MHARKAILKGLTPKQNLSIPKLNYERVYEIKKENPDLEIIINGGITNIEDIKKHLKICDGVMIGRAIYQNPYFLSEILKGSIPFMVMMVICIIILCIFPEIVTWLPDKLMGKALAY